MNRRTFLVVTILSLLSGFSSGPARGWNSPGHMIVALIAYEQMADGTRVKANELLRAHPRFEAHFARKMPRYLAQSGDERKSKWYFAHSGTWPDLVREAKDSVDREDVNRFNRPFWHYINRPIFLNDAERGKLEPGLKLYVNRTPPDDPDESGMNIIQAVKNSSRIVGDTHAPADRRAVHLCWLVHLAGDSHQPLHAGSLYTTNRFPRGDEGGNQLEAEHEWKLHAFWDSQICRQEDFGTLQTLAATVVKDTANAALGQNAACSTDIEQWIDESHDLAQRFVYTEEVLSRVAARETHTHLGPLNLSPDYRTDAEFLAERRAIEAGFRLGKLLDELLK